MMHLDSPEQYKAAFVSHLETTVKVKEPVTLYEPIAYILGLGGKRLRPVLTLMATDFFGGSAAKAMDVALAIELFHNFSLVHDDIMDAAPLRRGKATVHTKWDVNTAILSGDAMLIYAYQLFEGYRPKVFKTLVALFSKMARQVCEGQQYDMDFEGRGDVSIGEYLQMITCKTAVLVATALKMGAIVAGADEKDTEAIYRFGKNLGIAFQLQDDYLDVFGRPGVFGKQLGGDIRENKKTFLLLQTMALGSTAQREALVHWYSVQPTDFEAKVKAVSRLFVESGAVEEMQKQIARYTELAFEALDAIAVADAKKEAFKALGKSLIARTV